MSDAGGAVVVNPAWAVLAAGLLVFLATAAACLHAALESSQGGGRARQGALGPMIDVARLLRQRRRTLVSADALLWRVGGAGLGVVALLMISVVPLGNWVLSDLSIGVVWFNAMDVMVWALVWLAGWGANSTYSLIGGFRFLAQALAYELPLMFALTVPAVAAGSLNVTAIADEQGEVWFVAWMPIAFLVYCVSVIGFSAWGPLGTAAGTDISGGVLAETSGIDRLLIQAGRYCLLVAGAAFAVPMFLGGSSGPVMPDWAWVLIKTVALVAVMVTVARRLPAVRPDKLAEVGWIVLVPAVLAQLLVVSLIVSQR